MKKSMSIFGLQVIISITILAGLVPPCGAAPYPNRPIDFVVTAAVGGAVDTFARRIREAFAKEIGVPVHITNRPGVAGTTFVANSKGDGYTFTGQDLMTFLMRQVIASQKTLPYDVLKDFTPIAGCAYEPMVLVVRPDLGINTLKDLVSYAKANPEKLLAGTTVGGQNYVNLQLLNGAAGIKIRVLPLSGGGEVLTNLLGGHVDLTFPARSVAKPHLRAGKLRALAVLSEERLADLPDIPTTKEQGFPDVNINMHYVLLGPKGLAAPVVEKLAKTTKAVLTSPEVHTNLLKNGYLVDVSSPNQLRARLGKDLKRYTDLAKKEGFGVK